MKDILHKFIHGGGIFYDLSKWIILALVFLILVNQFWISIFIVDGISMDPNLKDGELVLMDKSYYRDDINPQRGDMVVIKYPGDPEQKKYIKRVIGLPFDTVAVRNGEVYLNGHLLEEPNLLFGTLTDQDGSWRLSENEYFLMGDNRLNSNDCRYFGPVEKRFFIGKAIFVLLPSPRSIIPPTYTIK